MKKSFLFALTVPFLVFSIFTSCNSPKKITEVTNVKSDTEIQIPLSGKQYQSDENYFRAVQSGESPDLSTAKKIAEQNAKATLASYVQALVKRVTDQYTNQVSVGDKKEYKNKFEELSREVVNQELKDTRVIGEKLYKLENGNYRYHVALEGNKEIILDGLSNRISKDAKLKLDFDKFQFQKIFDSEMKKFIDEENGNK